MPLSFPSFVPLSLKYALVSSCLPISGLAACIRFWRGLYTTPYPCLSQSIILVPFPRTPSRSDRLSSHSSSFLPLLQFILWRWIPTTLLTMSPGWKDISVFYTKCWVNGEYMSQVMLFRDLRFHSSLVRPKSSYPNPLKALQAAKMRGFHLQAPHSEKGNGENLWIPSSKRFLLLRNGPRPYVLSQHLPIVNLRLSSFYTCYFKRILASEKTNC